MNMKQKMLTLYAPLLDMIDRSLNNGSFTIAIEGGSAVGKTTLSRFLEERYDCAVFHMDDFFLQPHQRTEKRFAEPGGNVDRERFLSEVLLPLSQKKPVEYRRFDCSTLRLQAPVIIKPARLNIIEGAYCMHPDLRSHYDFSVFLEISPKQQKNRILKRNTPESAELFFNRWIPFELAYQETFHVKEQCDLVITIDED